MSSIELKYIGIVANHRSDLRDDDWGDVVSTITLSDDLSSDLLMGLDTFSHIEVVFVFHRLDGDKKVPDVRHPRDNQAWPALGLLAQRSSYHPNPIGLTTAKILGVEGPVITVQGLDAVNGSPVLDIKPIFQEFLPDNHKQPQWVSELLKDYWKQI